MQAVATAISKRTTESFQPSAEPARYPVLEHLSGRGVAEYMEITKLGTTETA